MESFRASGAGGCPRWSTNDDDIPEDNRPIPTGRRSRRQESRREKRKHHSEPLASTTHPWVVSISISSPLSVSVFLGTVCGTKEKTSVTIPPSTEVRGSPRSSPTNMPPSKADDLEMAPLVDYSSERGEDNKPTKHDDQNHRRFWQQHLRSSGMIKALSASAQYSFCSVSMILVNKSLASSYNHLLEGNLNILLVVFQAMTAVVCVETCKRLQIIEPYPTLNWPTVLSWAPVNIFFCLMLFTGMASLQTNSVPLVTVFKNVTNIATSIGDYIFFGTKSEGLVMLAFAVMLVGAILAAWKDVYVTGIGLFWMVANCLSTSGYVLYMKHATNNVKLSTFGMVFVNNVLCVAFLFPAALLAGDVSLFINSQALHTVDYFSKNVFAGFVGFFLNFASLNCVSATGPTTYAIVGSLNKIPTAFIGYILFDNVITAETWFFIGVSMAGGFLFTFAKLRTSLLKMSSNEASK